MVFVVERFGTNAHGSEKRTILCAYKRIIPEFHRAMQHHQQHQQPTKPHAHHRAKDYNYLPIEIAQSRRLLKEFLPVHVGTS